jgi:serine/threonine protein kinase
VTVLRMSNPNLRDTVPDDSGESAVSPAHLDRPERLGQYVLLELLGQGGMGSVYKARHALLDRIVALKVLSPARLADPQSVARFLREIKAVGKLNHPNLVHGTDAGQADGRHFLVMEFLQGIDLGKLVQQFGPLPVADACELVRQAALGLQHAHEHDLVHRDVKPSNLLLTQGGQVKVLDLGLARLLGDIPLGDELTDTGQYMGTADYMAPEQGFDAHAVDIRVDIYSLGCTLYKLLTGRAPFSGPEYDSTFKKIRAHSEKRVPPLREARPDVPAGLEAVLGKMLAKLPADRYATPDDAARALRPFADGADLPGLLTRVKAQETPSESLPSPLLEFAPRLPPRRLPASSATPRLSTPLTVIRSRWMLPGLIGLVLLGGIGLALFVLSRRTREDPPPGPVVVPADDSPGVWYYALTRKPTELHWPTDRAASRWWAEARERQVWLQCQDLGLLGLGETRGDRYELEVEIQQTPWVGNVGIFVGYYVDHSEGEDVHQFQFLELSPDPTGAPDLFRLSWRKVRFRVGDYQLRSLVMPPGLATPSFRVADGPHRLRLVVGKWGPEQVFFDGEEMHLNFNRFVNLLRGGKFRGVFGVCSLGSASIITDPRYRFFPR